jgi:hypothetical protein
MKNIIKIVNSLLPEGPMDAVGVGIIDFKSGNFETFEARNFAEEVTIHLKPEIFFDLASLTKPLTNSLAYFLAPASFDQKMLLCLSHRGGLPAWGLLPSKGWKEILSSYPIHESDTLYSDFSALRVMLELEKKNVDQMKICSTIWDEELVFWSDLRPDSMVVQTGFKNGLPNFGYVHDPNAWAIGQFCSHAGLFATTSGLCKTLVNYQSKTDFIGMVKKDLSTHNHRFAFGWDRVTNPNETLAGRGCGMFTFGHLGFTGTSIWIDPDQMKGHVILSNTTKFHWFDKANLNDLRRAIGELVWAGRV